MVACELAKQATWADNDYRLFHWRNGDGREIDLLAEHADGSVVAIEAKAAADLAEADLRHLAWLRDRLGPRFRNGAVLHLGDRARRWGDRLVSLPINALWDSER